jgi:hypothetical protein
MSATLIGSHSTINIASSLTTLKAPLTTLQVLLTTLQALLITLHVPPPPVKRRYSFSEAEQGAVVETFLTLAEKALYNLLVKYEDKTSRYTRRKF